MMRSEAVTVNAVKITGAPELDIIHVFWMDVAPGAGYCTIICYGSAWTAYFGSMGKNTIRQFFEGAETEYLVGKMGNTPHLKSTKRDNAYLARIIDAVKAYLALPAPPEVA